MRTLDSNVRRTRFARIRDVVSVLLARSPGGDDRRGLVGRGLTCECRQLGLEESHAGTRRGYCRPPPALDGGQIYLRTSEALYRFGTPRRE
jgi:hypothetical protein